MSIKDTKNGLRVSGGETDSEVGESATSDKLPARDAEQMALAEKIMREDREILRNLAE